MWRPVHVIAGVAGLVAGDRAPWRASRGTTPGNRCQMPRDENAALGEHHGRRTLWLARRRGTRQARIPTRCRRSRRRHGGGGFVARLRDAECCAQETDSSIDLDMVSDLRDDDGACAGRDRCRSVDRCPDAVDESAFEHVDATPRAAFRGVVAEEARRHGGLGELGRPATDGQVLRPLHGLATDAVEFGPQHAVPALAGRHPRPVLERGPVPHVPAVAAVEVGNPVTRVVAMESGDRTVHGGTRLGRRGNRIASHGGAERCQAPSGFLSGFDEALFNGTELGIGIRRASGGLVVLLRRTLRTTSCSVIQLFHGPRRSCDSGRGSHRVIGKRIGTGGGESCAHKSMC